MPGISIVDPSVKKLITPAELSIQVSPNGFSFCLLSDDLQLKAFRHYEFQHVVLFEDLLKEIEEVMKKDNLLKASSKHVRIIYIERTSTLLPDEYCEPESLKKILDFNQPIDNLDEIHINKIEGTELNLVFTVHHYITNLFVKRFKNATYYNQATPLLNYALKKEVKQTEVFIQINKEFFDIVILVEGELKLYNNFLYVNTTDLIYFILYACKQLNIDTKVTPFHFIGDFSDKIKLFIELASYLPKSSKLHLDEITGQTRFSHKIDASRFYSLLSLHKCAL